MAARNTATEVRVVWDAPSDIDDTAIGNFALLANRFVDLHVAGKACPDGVTVSEAQLKDIELYVTAYLLATRKPPPSSSSVLSVSATKQGSFAATGMIGNIFGQMAIEFDCTGALRALAAKANAAAQGEVEDSLLPEIGLLSDADQTLLT